LSRILSSSDLTSGIIEDLNIFHVRHPSGFYRTFSSAEIFDLTNSIAQRGLLQPIIVRPKEKDYEIVAGNRRFEACKSLRWRKITCHIVDLNDRDAFEVSLIENIQRKSLNPLEEAYAFKIYVKEFGWGGISDLAEKIGKSISYVDKRLRLLDLPKEVIENISNMKISASVAEELLNTPDLDKQSEIAEIVCEEGLSSRQTRKLIKDYKDVAVDKCEIEMFYVKTATNEEILERTFDRGIVILKMAMHRLANIIESVDENWIIYEILMQHKNMLNSQIDLLIKEKKKL
jgi:ParB family transcriptional regulator, chromosome partitioning protein